MRWFERIRHMIVTMWRFQNGGWFIFRDRPDWFVDEMALAVIPIEGHPLERYVEQARHEQRSRTRKIFLDAIRKIENEKLQRGG